MKHESHQMKITSLQCFFPKWDQEEFNNKFRNETRIKIIRLLQEHKEGLTDTEIGILIGCHPNLNVNRSRRNDLSREKDNKFNNIIVDSGNTRTNIDRNRETVWMLNEERLDVYMRG